MSYTQDVRAEDVMALLEALWLDLNSEHRATAKRQVDEIKARHR